MLWVKAFHIIAMTCWFAGLLYLPRLFVYHQTHQHEATLSNTFKTMEYKLYYFIMHPAALLTIILGIILIYLMPQYLHQHWLHLKLSLVLVVFAYHLSLAYFLKQFKKDNNRFSGRFYRFYNEIPALLLVGIVLLAVIKPL